MELLGYRKCTDGDSKPDLPASVKQDKVNAYMTLYTALVTVSMTAAPLIPFMAEGIYQNLVRSIDKGCSIICSSVRVPEGRGEDDRHRP